MNGGEISLPIITGPIYANSLQTEEEVPLLLLFVLFLPLSVPLGECVANEPQKLITPNDHLLPSRLVCGAVTAADSFHHQNHQQPSIHPVERRSRSGGFPNYVVRTHNYFAALSFTHQLEGISRRWRRRRKNKNETQNLQRRRPRSDKYSCSSSTFTAKDDIAEIPVQGGVGGLEEELTDWPWLKRRRTRKKETMFCLLLFRENHLQDVVEERPADGGD